MIILTARTRCRIKGNYKCNKYVRKSGIDRLEKTCVFLARYSFMERFRKIFDADQHIVMTSLVDLDYWDWWSSPTVLMVTYILKDLYDVIITVYQKISNPSISMEVTSEYHQYNKHMNMYTYRSHALPKINFLKFNDKLVQWGKFRVWMLFMKIMRFPKLTNFIILFHVYWLHRRPSLNKCLYIII